MEQNDEAIAKIRELISGIDYCMLTTVNDDGRLHSRPMATMDAGEFSGELWFFTSASSHKVFEIKRDNQVNLNYADPKHQTYVSLSGSAELVRDKQEIKSRWKPALRAWFPEGADDPDTALLRVQVTGAEYWDSSSSFIAHAIGLAGSLLRGKPFRPGDHQAIEV